MAELIDIMKIKEGWFDYNHSDGLQSVGISAWTKLINNGTGIYTNKLYGNTGITDIYNTATSQFDFTSLSLGDSVIMRLSLFADTLTTFTDIDCRMNMAVGSVSNYQIHVGSTISYKNIGTGWLMVYNTIISMDNQFTIDNPAQLEIFADKAINANVIGYKIFVNKRTF